MKKRLLRIYADASVFGGCVRQGSRPSQPYILRSNPRRQISVGDLCYRAGGDRKRACASKKLFDEMLEFAEIVNVTQAATRLAQAYLEAQIVTPKWETDALHVAIATVSTCSLIVSWNFTHIVHFDKISRYNAVNTLNGHTTIAIHSPQEVIRYEENL